MRSTAGFVASQNGEPAYLGDGPVILPDEHWGLRWLTEAPPGYGPNAATSEEGPEARASVSSVATRLKD